MFHLTKVAGAFLAGALAFGATAMAPPPEVSSRVVIYGDLDLSTRQGDQALLKRLNAAAVKDCGGYPDLADLDVYLRFDKCFTDAMNGAIRSVGNRSVTALYEHKASRRLG
jgi:UrcA family protein